MCPYGAFLCCHVLALLMALVCDLLHHLYFFDLLILFPALVLVAHIRHTFELKFNHTDVILLAIFSTDCLILGIKVCSYAVWLKPCHVWPCVSPIGQHRAQQGRKSHFYRNSILDGILKFIIFWKMRKKYRWPLPYLEAYTHFFIQ